jgi:glycosyltransferase involved in cell wall biosynthesis
MPDERMRILCVIDHLGLGGAQRQMVELACGLRRRGHTVEFFVYHPQHDFFGPRVAEFGIPVHESLKRHRFSLSMVSRLKAVTKASRADLVLAYLSTPSIYAELSRLFGSRAKLIVSERSSRHAERSRIRAHVTRRLHGFADHVVTNSRSHQRWLVETYPWLSSRTSTIFNGVDVLSYTAEPPDLREPVELKLLAIGRATPLKNALNLARAAELFLKQHGWVPRITWAGRIDEDSDAKDYRRAVDAVLRAVPELEKSWEWAGERSDIAELLREHHALVHPSFYEGFPNAICEALAAGRVVLASNVCDHAELVEEGMRGFLFDPADPESIARCMGKLASLSPSEWLELSGNSRVYAEHALTSERMVSEYEMLFRKLVSGD